MNHFRRRQRNFSSFFRWGIIIAMTCTVGVVGSIVAAKTFVYRDSSMDGSEIAEQRAIPPDVAAYIQKRREVLASTTEEPTVTPLPFQLRIPILMFHYVEYVADRGDTIRISLDTTPYTLEQEIKTLQESGYTFLTMSEVADALDGSTKLPPKPIALTFDDGYRDFYTDAYPILQKYHAKATQYVISGFLDRPNHLRTSQVKEISDGGLVEIGAHTVHHLWLRGLPDVIVQNEITESKKALQQITGRPVVSFAYPYGAFDVQALNDVAGAGFRTSVSTIPGIDQEQIYRYFLYRLRPGGRVGTTLLSWLDTVTDTKPMSLR